MGFNTRAWLENANADNQAAVATRSGEAGRSHYIEGITGSYGLSKSGLLTIKDDTTIIYRYFVYDTDHIEFPQPIKITEGNAAHVELAASGTGGTIGYVSMQGTTE